MTSATVVVLLTLLLGIQPPQQCRRGKAVGGKAPRFLILAQRCAAAPAQHPVRRSQIITKRFQRGLKA